MNTLGLNGLFLDLFFRKPADADYDLGGGVFTDSDPLYLFIWYVSIFFFLLVVGLMFYFAWKYRRVPGKAAEVSPSHNTMLEITWTVIPTLILFVIFIWGYNGYISTQTAPVEAEQIELSGFKWSWTMTYDNGKQSAESGLISGDGSTEVPVFYVPEDTPVRLKMSSADVIHSFWVPDFRTKIDVMPNRYTPYWFRAAALADGQPDEIQNGTLKDGTEYQYRDHWIFCAEFCGDQHSEMAAILRVVPMPIYKAWKSDPGFDETTPLPDVGAIVWKAKGCNACHSVDGSPNTGPTWQNSYGYDIPLADGSSIPADDTLEWENYIRESILEPGAKLHAGYANQMPSYNGRINELELSGVIAYMKSLSDRAPASPVDDAPAGTPDEEIGPGDL